MKRYRGFVGQVSPLGCATCESEGLGITRKSLYNGYGDYLERRRLITTEPIRATDIYQSSPKLPPPPVIEPSPVLEPTPQPVQVSIPTFGTGYDWQGNLLPGWTQPHCFQAPCPPMYTGTVSPGDQEIEKRQYAEGGDGRAELLETQAEIDQAIKRATGGSGPTETIMPVGTKPEMPALLPLAIGAALIYFMR